MDDYGSWIAVCMAVANQNNIPMRVANNIASTTPAEWPSDLQGWLCCSWLNVPITTNLVCRSRAVPSAVPSACACAQCAQLLWCRGLQGWKSSVPQLSPWLGSLLAAHRCTAPQPQHSRCPGPRPAAVRWCCCANPGFDANCCKKCILTKMFASTCVASRLGYQSGCWEATGWENGVFDLIGLSLDYLCLHSKWRDTELQKCNPSMKSIIELKCQVI